MYKIAVLTASDKGSKGEREDDSAKVIFELVKNLGEICGYSVVEDDVEKIQEELLNMADILGCDLLLTTGGTGLGPRDVTPEATLNIIEKNVPGLSIAMISQGLKHTPNAALSRSVAGIRGKTLIINLPGSPKGVSENLSAILPVLPHALEILRGESADCADMEPPAQF